MLYLLDANVLISAHELHYPLDRVPQFWTWLLAMAATGSVKLPFEIYNEIAISTGDLKDWLHDPGKQQKAYTGRSGRSRDSPASRLRVTHQTSTKATWNRSGKIPFWWRMPYSSARP